ERKGASVAAAGLGHGSFLGGRQGSWKRRGQVVVVGRAPCKAETTCPGMACPISRHCQINGMPAPASPLPLWNGATWGAMGNGSPDPAFMALRQPVPAPSER